MLPEEIPNKIDPTLSFHLMKFAFQDFQKSSAELSEEEYIQTYRLANEEMLLHQLVLSSHESCYVVIPKPILNLALSSVISEYPDETTFHGFLEQNDLGYDDYLIALHNDLRVEAVLTQVASTIQDVSPLEILHYFQLHQDDFSHPEQRHASLITIGFDVSSREQALKQILTIQQRLKKNPGNFKHEANLYSHCNSSQNGGNIGTIKAGELCEELDQQLFQLKRGKISPVIISNNGFHLLYCRKIIPGKNICFAQASAEISSLLLRKKQLATCQSWLKSLVLPLCDRP